MSLPQATYILSDCVSLFGGGTPSKDNPEYWDGDIPWASVKDLKGNRLNNTQDSISALGLANSSSKIVKAGSIIMATRMAVGRVAITDLDVAINQDLKAFVCSDKVDVKYLFYFLFSQENNFNKAASGATVKGIKINHIMDMRIPLPPLAEQQKIAAILDAADSLRQKDQQLIDKYNALSQSLFLDMFGDPVVNPHNFPTSKLSDAYINVKEGTKCGPFGSALKKFEYTEKGVPVWVMDNIQESNFVFEKCLFITEEKYLSLNNYSTLRGDIIISRAGTVGKMCVVPDGYKQAIISTNLIRLRLDKKILLPLFFVLLMKYFAPKVGRIKTGPDGAFTHMNTGVLNDLTFPFPPISLQNQFAERIQSIEAQRQQAQASLEKSEALFNSLLQRAFKGELT